ncbi:unnamed protein product [Adineta steineri]|uniref:Very-long-chain 3-oxoacyl-CoA synthase n=1 Tax=Adineta steineri TaxID=433720 RepID=A0A818N3D0_9BILA|nr:unnamed protein product [Adineta steineri]CAF3599936.1 unnamed protein product [Adineta steineri]
MYNWWWLSILYALMYIIAIFVGQRWMRKQNEKFELRGALVLWNTILTIFSFWGACRSVPELIHTLTHHGFVYSICDPSFKQGITGLWAWLFMISKFPETIDTLFIVLRRQQLIFLHWYHHASVLVYCFYSYAYFVSTGRWFVSMNYCVHTLMYGYFALRAARIRLPRFFQQFITILQLIQMIIGCMINIAAYYYKQQGYSCAVSYTNIEVSLAIIISIILFIVYIKLKYFTLYGSIPGKSPQFLLGHLLQTGFIYGKYLGDIVREFQIKYGDTFQFFAGPIHMIFVCNPEDVQHIFTHRHIYEQGNLEVDHHRILFNDALICNIGAKYKRHASIILPLFRRGKIVNNLDIIVDCTDKLLDQWRLKTDIDPNYIHLNIVDQCQNLSLAIFGFIGFDYDLQTLNEYSTNKKNKLRLALSDFLKIFLVTIPIPTFLSRIYLKISPRYRHAMITISTYLNQIILQEQRKTPEEIDERKRTSLIASLIGSLQQDEKLEAIKPEQEKKGLSRREVIDELLLFLVAGSETTGSVLAWFIYLMSKNPRVQAKIKVELADKTQHGLTIDQIDSLIYLDYVIQEVLRFIPPVVGTTRTLTADDRLPTSSIQLYKGEEVFIPLNVLSRDKRYWKIDPDLFYPERFQNEDANHHAYASIPFGGGHRQCIGQDLARFELKVIMTRLMQYVTFGDGGVDVNAGGYVQKMTVIPKHIGITVTFD